jgi:hypothetical protein
MNDEPPAGAVPLFPLDRREITVQVLPVDEFALKYMTSAGAVWDADHLFIDPLKAELASGKWRAWGREGSPVGPWRALPPTAWQHLVIDYRQRIVRAQSPGDLVLFDVRIEPYTAAAPLASRKQPPEAIASQKLRVETVLAIARTLWPDETRRPPVEQMAQELFRRGKNQGYRPETLRKILFGKYPATRRSGR